jgi:hypothetical protein
MENKILEIRDRATTMVVWAQSIIPENAIEHRLLVRAGFSDTYISIMLWHMDGGSNYASVDPYAWHSRTMHYAHLELQKKWESYKTGDVLDIEYILGETSLPKESEIDPE